MVKSGGELPEGEAAALVHTMQPLSSPEWKFPSIARPKTKRVGTPYPEKARQALKRAGLESGSEVSRAKKKMVFDMVDELAEIHGVREKSAVSEHVPFGEMLFSLAQMAKEGGGPTTMGTAGTSPALAPASRILDAPSLECELVNKMDVASTPSHVQPRGEDGVVCDGVGACDSPKEEKTRDTLHGEEIVAPFVDNNVWNSNVAPCAIHIHLDNDGGKDERGSGARPPESPPEKVAPPANAWKEAKDLFSHGGTGAMVGAPTPHTTHKAEPFPLDAGKATPMGTAGSFEGTPYLSFTDLETECLSKKLGLAIVGKFSHSLPSSFQIQKSLGCMGLVGAYTWKYLNAKHILLQFQEVADYAKVINGPNGSPIWYLNNHPMRVFKWAPDFDTFFESPIVAVWCNIMGIPAHLFEESALMAIGKLLGKPLLVDHATINQTRLSFARLCVEIDISKAPTEEIILNILGKESRHKVAWDRIPLFCENCKHVGHVIDDCHELGRKGRVGGKDHRASTKVFHPSHVPKTIRREWRPKVATRVGTPPNNDHTYEENERDNQEENKKGKMEADPLGSRASFGSQPSVDEDGFQLVSRKRKGMARKGGTHPKAPHIDHWRSKDNVATVSFVRNEPRASEPSTCSMSVSCGLPDREKEGFIEELDPGGITHHGGIPIAGLN